MIGIVQVGILRLVEVVPNPYLRRIEERLTRAQQRRMILCLNARGRTKSIICNFGSDLKTTDKDGCM